MRTAPFMFDGFCRFNTASGMDCMQLMIKHVGTVRLSGSFNTASGMDCMQFVENATVVSVEARFNTASGMDCMQ